MQIQNKAKNWIARVVGICWLVMVIIPAVAAAKTSYFPDVKADYIYLPAINYLKEQGLINGYPDGTFQPEKSINRAEALKIVLLARTKLGLNLSGNNPVINFPDIKVTDWFFEYVKQANSLGIVKGYQDGNFKPANEITRAESLKMSIFGLVKNFQDVTTSANPFSDVTKDLWYAGLVAYSKNRQIVDGNLDNKWEPERKITRAEFADIIYRTFYSEVNGQEKFPISLNWEYCNNYEVGYKVRIPNGWSTIPAGRQMIMWKKDLANGQVSFARVYPNSAVVIAAMDENLDGLSLEKYLESLEYGSTANKQVITLNGMPYASIFIEQSGLQDSYFQMPNGKILVLYAQVGDGEDSIKLKEEVRYLLGSVRASDISSNEEKNCLANSASIPSTNNTTGTVSPDPGSIIKADILNKVLLPGQSDNVLSLMSDEILMETDSIGIGTGPVDYYFSETIKITLKIDRNSKTLLAVKDGKTSAF